MKNLSMKNLSIRHKIIFWFSTALLVVVFFAYLVVFAVSNQIIQKTIRDNLIEAVEHNVDEFEFYSYKKELDARNEVDDYIYYNDGYLVIDDDFLDQVNQVYTGLYGDGGRLLYGENPISVETVERTFTDAKVQKIRVDGILYYIFDRKLEKEGLEGLWLRGVVSELQGAAQMSDIIRISLILLPVLVFFAIIGGNLIAKRTLRPIQEIAATASRIGDGDDLKQRIELGEGKDELHQLADQFNGMFERLDKAFEAERQFTSDASHELRTPLTVIMAQCDYTLEETRNVEEYERAIGVIQRQGRKMSRLVRDMLEFTRLEMRADSYQKEPVSMSELVSSICVDMALIREQNITLTWEADEGVVCYGNRQLLSRMLMNLISNAYRYGKEQGHIAVSLKGDDTGINLLVSDDGIGIAKAEQDKIFRRFYQADVSRTDDGTGLGLAMVYEIVQFHGGLIRVESALGEGSTFAVWLPRQK